MLVGILIKNKSVSTVAWCSMIFVVKSIGNIISRVRIDNDTALLCHDFSELCQAEVITVERTITYAHLLMGRIERH
jgi:hypothetical protein